MHQQGWACGSRRFCFAALWSFSFEEVLLGNHSAQSPASVCVASPGRAQGHCKGKCSLCSVQQVWWSLHWVQQQGWACGLVFLFCFAAMLSFSDDLVPLSNHIA